MTQPRTDLQAQGDRELRAKLLAEREVQHAIEQIGKQFDRLDARRQLLATATRLTREMSPGLHAIVDSCRDTLGVDGPLELFVYPGAVFNAAAVRPERGRLLFMVSSSLLEGFDDDELRFVIGHEVGHYLFDHHAIPTGALLGGGRRLSPDLALRLFSWQRWAEISSDRAGLVCAGGLEPAASGLFKLASGLSRGRIAIRIDQFLAQVGDLQAESEEHRPTGDDVPRGDWFSTHPFSPLRLKAAELFAASEMLKDGGTPMPQLEDQVQDLMTLMDPSYLQAKTEVAESMRRLLFAGGVAVAAAGGAISQEAIGELERLLGPGSLPSELKPEVIAADLPSRIEAVKAKVPALRRSQVVRDLCVIARADGCASDAEVRVIRDIASAVDVEDTLVAHAIAAASDCD